MHERDHARELGAVRSGLAATALLCVVELVGGSLTNSLALISDAAHMFTDMAALGLTLFALWICSRPASETKTFGYYRAEILAALVNGVVLWVIVVFIVAEAWRRLHDPPPVAGRGLLALALAGLAVNAVVALRLREHRARSLNLRGAYLHVLSDLLGSFGAAAAGLVIVLTGWNAADALASGLIAALILLGSWALVREVEHALAVYEQGLGFARVDEPSDVPSLGARHVFLRAENCLLELVQPHDERSPPGLFLRQRGEGMFAMELRVDDPAQAREHLAHASVQTPGAAERWYVRPVDAHGMLVEVAPAAAPDPA